MLTRREINRVARLMDQVGELRPGFLQDGTSNLEGAVEPCHSVGIMGKSSKNGSPKKTVRLHVSFETDEATGEIRVVRRK